MKALISLFLFLLVFSLAVFPLVFCDFFEVSDASAPVLTVSRQEGTRPFAVTLSPAALKASPFLKRIEAAADFLPFFVKDGVAALAKETGDLCLSLLSLLS